MAILVCSLLALITGLLVGYVSGARYKQQYLAVARELANLRGENFRNTVPTMGIPRTAAAPAATAVPAPRTSGTAGGSVSNGPTDAELTAARQRIESLQQERNQLQLRITELEQSLVDAQQREADDEGVMAIALADEDDRVAEQIGQLQRELQDAQEESERLRARIVELEINVARASADLSTAQDELAAQSESIAAMKRAEEERLASTPAAQEDSQAGDQRVADMESEVARLQEQIATQMVESSSLRKQLGELQTALDRESAALAAAREREAQREREAAAQPTPSITTGTESWQLAQLHREQIMLQIQIDGHLQKIRELTAQRDALQTQATQASQQVEQLRMLLAQQEATIASLERERDALRTRAEIAEAAEHRE